MLSLRINLDSLRERRTSSTAVADMLCASIEPFESKFVSMSVLQNERCVRVIVSEVGWPTTNWSASVPVSGLDTAPFQAAEVLFTLDEDPALVITRSSSVGAPLFVATQGREVAVTWRFEEAVAVLDRPRPNMAACRLYLREGPSLTRDQVIEGVHMIWPGESVSFSETGLTFQTCRRQEVTVPSVLTDNGRATDELVSRIAQAMAPMLVCARSPMIEVSGGLDSACTAVAAASVRKNLYSYGLVHEGAVGIQQRNRRAEIVSLLGLKDFEYPSNAPSLFAALVHEECTITPFDDNHRLPCVFAVDNHYAEDVDLVISGIGGDELAMEQTYQRHDWELPGTACRSSLTSAAQRYDMFMRRGIWVANPLTSQPVGDLCRAFPGSLRNARMLNVLLLARAGLSDGFLFPRVSEHYGNGMQREAALIDFDRALASSIVADHGVTDISPVLTAARKASNGGFSYKLIMDLFWLLKLEAVLRRYVL